MPTENENNKVDSLIDVGESDQQATEINLDKTGEPEKVETPVEEKIEVEQVGEEETVTPVETKKEEKAKDEHGEYSEGVQKRIAKLTRKMREAERQREEAIAFADKTNRQKSELEGRLSKLDKSYTSEFESRVKTNMVAARQALKTAIEAQDVDGQVKAQEQIANLTMDGARLNAMKAAEQAKPEPKEVNVTPQQTRQPAQSDPMAEAWASENAWFGNDSAMTYTAFDIHKTLVEKEGFDPQSQEYYAEVDKRIRVDFPNRFDNNESRSTKPAQTVASVRRGVKPGRKSVKLTPSEITIARKLGVPPEEYARQKLNMKEV